MPTKLQKRFPKGKRPTTTSRLAGQYFNVVDRTRTLGDGSVGSPQDRFQLKPLSNSPPTTIPLDFSRQGYWLKNTVLSTTFNTSQTLNTYTSYNFKLADLAPLASLTALFDQYSIVEVVLRVVPQVVSSQAGSAPGQYVSVIDYDDANALTSLANAQEYSTALTTNGYVGQTRVLMPRVAIAAYSGAFTSFANQRTYIDCASSTVQHYGVKMVMTPSTGAAYLYTVYADYVVHFRENH